MVVSDNNISKILAFARQIMYLSNFLSFKPFIHKNSSLKMNRIILPVLFLIYTFPIMAVQQTNDTIYYDAHWAQTDKENARYYRLVSIDTTRIRFLVKDYFVSGKLQMEGAYKSINPDFKIGSFAYWYENGDKHINCTFEQNKLHGIYREWYPDGIQKSEKNYYHGNLEGLKKDWDETGKIVKTVEYKDGLKNGHFTTYYENGQPIRKDLYKNDRLVKGKCFSQNGKDTVYFEYFTMPHFNGGLNGFKLFITEKLNYPDSARENNEEAMVKVRFTIDREGNVTHVKLVKGDKNYFNAEAIRAVNESPKWIPGKRDGKVIDVTITIPIYFRLK